MTAIACAGIFVFGIVMALLGAIMPSLSATLGFNLAEAGTLFLIMNGCMLATSLMLGILMDRFGMKPPLAIGPFLVAAALALIASAARYADLLPAVVLAGVGGGALNGGTNTLVADLNEDERSKASALNLLGVFFGFGAVFLPFTIGALLGRAGVKGALYCAAGLCAVTGVAALLLRFPRPKQPHRLPLREMSGFVRMPVVLALAILLFFQSGNEFLLGGYFASFLTERFAVSLSAASYVLAGYWAALMVARLVLARVLLRLDGHTVIRWCALTAAAGCLLTGLAVSPLMAGASMLLTGAALAGIFPTVLGIAGARFHEHSGTVFGLLFTVALAGGMTIPSVAGQLGQAAGLRAVFWLAAAGFLAIAVLNRTIPRTARPDALVSRPAR